jgi:hypothetical protein
VAKAAGLPGSFKAWLSTPTVDAIDRIADVGPWYQTPSDGGVVKTFNNKANLTGAAIVGIGTTETGEHLNLRGVWTGTAAGGKKTSSTCAGFTIADAGYGTIGASASATEWTNGGPGTSTCPSGNHLYCFQQ